jgi:hypothetical protein
MLSRGQRSLRGLSTGCAVADVRVYVFTLVVHPEAARSIRPNFEVGNGGADECGGGLRETARSNLIGMQAARLVMRKKRRKFEMLQTNESKNTRAFSLVYRLAHHNHPRADPAEKNLSGHGRRPISNGPGPLMEGVRRWCISVSPCRPRSARRPRQTRHSTARLTSEGEVRARRPALRLCAVLGSACLCCRP